MKIFLLTIVSSFSLTIPCQADDAEEAYTRGTKLMQQGMPKDAIPFFDTAIRLNPQFLAAWQNRGLCHTTIGEHDKALADAGEALKLNPDFALGYQLRAFVFYKQKKHNEAIKEGDEAIRLMPNYAAALNTRGLNKSAIGHLDDAVKDFDAAIKSQPKPDYYYNRGNVKYKLGQNAAAESDYGKTIKENPAAFWALGMRAVVRTKLGDDKGASEDLEACGKLNPDARKTYEKMFKAAAAQRPKNKN